MYKVILDFDILDFILDFETEPRTLNYTQLPKILCKGSLAIPWGTYSEGLGL